MSNDRNQSTRHEDKSCRREGALFRLKFRDMPESPAQPKSTLANMARSKKKEKGVISEATLSQHEQFLLDEAKRAHERDCERVSVHNTRVAAERATLEERIGKPPRQWPKRALKIETPRDAYPRDVGFDEGTADDINQSWDAYMCSPTTGA